MNMIMQQTKTITTEIKKNIIMTQLLFLILITTIIATPIIFFCNFIAEYRAPYNVFMDEFNTYTGGARYKITFEQFLEMYNEIKENYPIHISCLGVRCYKSEFTCNKWRVCYNENAYSFSFLEYRKYLDWLNKTIKENICEVQDMTKSN